MYLISEIINRHSQRSISISLDFSPNSIETFLKLYNSKHDCTLFWCFLKCVAEIKRVCLTLHGRWTSAS